MKSIEDVENFLANLPPSGRLGVERLRFLEGILGKLGSPQDTIPAIHIAGTSGKGSTAYYAAELLAQSGYNVGLTVSPHVTSIFERAQIIGRPLTTTKYIEYINEFRGHIEQLGEALTYIEFLDIFAFWLFAKVDVDYMVIEVGLGGRLDPTNVITKGRTVRVITDIGLDHTEILGSTLPEIAREKTGIIHSRDLVVTHRQAAEIDAVIKRSAKTHHAELFYATDVPMPSNRLPSFQQRNWQLARRAVELRLQTDHEPPPTTNAIEHSLSLTIPGRFEIVNSNNQTIVLDAAHNPQKIATLVRALSETFPKAPIVCLVSLGANKVGSARESLERLSNISRNIIATEFDLEFNGMHGALPARELAKLSHAITQEIKDPFAAFSEALRTANTLSAILVVTGSFYLVSNVKAIDIIVGAIPQQAL